VQAVGDFFAQPLFGVAVTVGLYVAALQLHRRWAWLHPLVVTGLALLTLIWSADIPQESYSKGGDILTFFLGPATVALAVPIYKRRDQIRAHALAILGSIATGGAVAIAASWVTVWLLGGSHDVLLAMLPRSATTPISVGIVNELHGKPELAALFTVVSGLLGAALGPAFLRLVGVRNDLALGLGIGTAAHGIGTSSVIRRSEMQGAAAGLAMALNGIYTSVLMIPLYYWFAQHPPK
jgi:predicted murein hydrolase (TIGR00659 family)